MKHLYDLKNYFPFCPSQSSKANLKVSYINFPFRLIAKVHLIAWRFCLDGSMPESFEPLLI
jgi:hypothetical protein